MQNNVQMFARLFTFIIALGFASIAAIAETPKTKRGVALVIGQSAYKNLSPLTNPANDARDMEKALRNLGFEITVLTDLTAKKLRRDLENFAVDAEGADVAVVYYSGHGIEAGGENWLVPIDADISAPESAAGKLVALSTLLSSLKSSVPITLLFLDACRSNPFPAGMQLIKEGKPVPISASGLVLTRGAGSEVEAHAKEGYGTVIGFAAEPGRPALDGEPGGNSPYAAALLRHLQAMNGEEFGVVMRMVTQEVYLKTKGQQRPWTNESLAKLLYFGAKPQDLSGDEGQILGERRKLLLTIDGLGEDQRKQVEQAAKSGGVPMDALYGLMRALGSETPKDPKELDKILVAQTEKLKTIIDDRNALTSPDPELARLSSLADQALVDGALDANLKFREMAKTHFAKIESKLDDTEANLKARRIEGADIFGKVAEAYDLKAEFLSAAENYAKAFEQVEKWDKQKAWQYKFEEAGSLQAHGSQFGSKLALSNAVNAYQTALTLTDVDANDSNWAETQHKLGYTLSELGERDTSLDRLQESLLVLQSALEKRPRATAPKQWGEIQNDLANTLTYLGRRQSNEVQLNQAAGIYRELLQYWDRNETPNDWGNAQHNLSNVLLAINTIEPNIETLNEALVAINLSLEIWPREEFGYDFAFGQINRAYILNALGVLGGDVEKYAQALTANAEALEEIAQESYPLVWARIQTNIGSTLLLLADHHPNSDYIKQAIIAFDAALEERTRENVPLDWAGTLEEKGRAFEMLGRTETGVESFLAAEAVYAMVLQELDSKKTPDDWAYLQNNIGVSLHLRGTRLADRKVLESAVDAFTNALTVHTKSTNAKEWERGTTNLALAHLELGILATDNKDFELAEKIYRKLLEANPRDAQPEKWTSLMFDLGNAMRRRGDRSSDPELLSDAITVLSSGLEVQTKESDASELARGHLNLGYALLSLAEQEKTNANTWVLAAQSLLQVQTTVLKEQDLAYWSNLQNDMGYALVRAAEIEENADLASKTIGLLREAVTGYEEAENADVAFARGSLCYALQVSSYLNNELDLLLEAKPLCESAMLTFKALKNKTAISETEKLLKKIAIALQ